jgi:hypothetical protein
MAYRSPLEIRDGLVAIPDTPLFSDRHHPVFRIALPELLSHHDNVSLLHFVKIHDSHRYKF